MFDNFTATNGIISFSNLTEHIFVMYYSLHKALTIWLMPDNWTNFPVSEAATHGYKEGGGIQEDVKG